MTPQKLPKHSINNDRSNIGKCYELAVYGGKKGTAILYHHNIETERVDLSDTPAKRIFIVRLVERKVNQRMLAEKLNISRQTIHNYVERKEHFGLEGLINSYHVSPDTSLEEQRKENLAKCPRGNLSRKLEEIRRKERAEARKNPTIKSCQRSLPFTVEGRDGAQSISSEEQPFVEQHDWIESRYAGVFIYESVDLLGFWFEIKAYEKNNHRHTFDIPRIIFFA